MDLLYRSAQQDSCPPHSFGLGSWNQLLQNQCLERQEFSSFQHTFPLDPGHWVPRVCCLCCLLRSASFLIINGSCCRSKTWSDLCFSDPCWSGLPQHTLSSLGGAGALIYISEEWSGAALCSPCAGTVQRRPSYGSCCFANHILQNECQSSCFLSCFTSSTEH